MSDFKQFDIVEVVTNKRQEEASLATILDMAEFEGEEAALIQYHYKSCGPDTVCTQYMKKHIY